MLYGIKIDLPLSEQIIIRLSDGRILQKRSHAATAEANDLSMHWLKPIFKYLQKGELLK